MYLQDKLVPYKQCGICLSLFAYVSAFCDGKYWGILSAIVFFFSIVNSYPVNMLFSLSLNVIFIVYEYRIC